MVGARGHLDPTSVVALQRWRMCRTSDALANLVSSGDTMSMGSMGLVDVFNLLTANLDLHGHRSGGRLVARLRKSFLAVYESFDCSSVCVLHRFDVGLNPTSSNYEYIDVLVRARV